MGEKVKTLDFLGGCNFRKGKFRVSPNVGQKTGLNKVVVGTFEMGTDSSRFRSELKTTSSAS
jgi:hypothetical protein